MKRAWWIGGLTVGVVAMALSASSSSTPSGRPTALFSSAQAAPSASTAESLEQAFIRVGQDVGPAVVSISTEQIEQVQRYYRVHPFFGQGQQEPFDEFFRQFFGEGPQGREFKRFGLGSGVIIDKRGYILTNEHVIADAEKITVTLADGRELVGEVKGKDTRADLAVVKIEAKELPAATLGDSDSIHTGQWAIALGNPFGLIGYGSPNQALGAEPTLTVGVISALHRRLPGAGRSNRDYSDLVQTDAAINPGNSGGPLLNLQGQVIGINVAILSSSRGFEGVGFAIPVNKAKAILDALIEGRKVLYGWLGIQIQDITQDVADYYKLTDRHGVLVYQVLPDGPAEQGSMKDGDIIKTFDGKPVSNTRELVDIVGKTTVGRKVPVEVWREGAQRTVNVEVGERPSEDTESGESPSGESWRGVRVAELNPSLAERFGLEENASGVVVADVDPNSPADEAHLQPGDVINEINRTRIASLSDYRKATAAVKGNALVRTSRGYVVVKAGGS
jgi:serine protease Do